MKATNQPADFSAIDSHVQRTCKLTTAQLNRFHELLELRSVPKKTVLLHPGEICQFEAYVNKGCLRTYYINEDGAEIVLQFAVEDWWISDIASFHNQVPGRLFIETLENCELFILTPETKEQLLLEIPAFERFFRLLVQRHLTSLQNRVISTLSLNGENKFRLFAQQYPAILKRVPQFHIAAYLGMTPEFLSKVRSRISKK